MSNGQRIVVLRILASAIISMTALVCATWLMDRGVLVPTAFWLIAIMAVGGVAGADVVTAILHAKGEAITNGA